VRQIVERSEREVERGHFESAIDLLEHAIALGADPDAVQRVLEMLCRRAGSWSRAGHGGRGPWMRSSRAISSGRADPGRPRPPSRG
jgi:hypothetical protein